MTAHDDLRRRLLDSVSARGSDATRAARATRRRRRPRRGLAVAVLALAIGGGVAGATTRLLSGSGARERARSLVQVAVTRASAQSACGRAAVTFVNTPASAEVRSVFGSRSTPVAPGVRALVRRQASGEVRSPSVRLVAARDGRRILVYAAASASPFTVRDRAACDRAERSCLLELHPRDDEVRRLARGMLAHDQRMRSAGGETLFLSLIDDNSASVAATGVAVGHRRVPTGVLLESSTAGYAGIAAAGARSIRVSTTDPRSRHPLRRTYPVRERVFAFTLPGDTGPVEVRQLAADGGAVAVEIVRARRTRRAR